MLRIKLLGGFAIWVNGERIPEEQWHSQRARSLIKLLALTPNHRLHREQVIEALWPDSDLSASVNNFHQTLHMARQILRQVGPACLVLEEGFLHPLDGDPSGLIVDVDQFEAAVMAITASRQSRLSLDPEVYKAALALYPGDLLPDDLYEKWVAPQREALRQIYVQLLLDLAHHYETRGPYPAGIDILHRLLAADKCHEEAHAGLMRLYALCGQRQQALRQYHTLRELLQTEISVEPSLATTYMFGEIQANRFPSAVVSSPPVSSDYLSPATSPHHNLPAQLTSFIGREEQIAQIRGLVRSQRLVTLTGAGGVGKTRLALQVAGGLLGDFSDGVFLVELASLSDPGLLPQTCAQALNIIQQSGLPLLDLLVHYLEKKHLLLILDNCEHLIEACVRLVDRLLKACPRLTILATSREILAMQGEHSYRVPSLLVPDPANNLEVEVLAKVEAARLFIERATQVNPDFILTDANARAVVQICQRLDGIPLAIELAAARSRMLAIEQIAARLDNAFCLLTGGSRVALPRHQTLKAMIDWSYDLLSLQEQVLLQRLAVFAGGWTLEAAEEVCADPKDRTSPGGEARPMWFSKESILTLMGQLVDKSLIQFELPLTGFAPRYRMLATIRQYTYERLAEAGGEVMARSRHLDYFLALALQAEPHLRARDANHWLNCLDGELDNLRLALDWSLKYEIEKGLQLGAALLWLWWIRGHSLEGAEWLERLLQAQENRPDFPILPLSGWVARGRAINTLSNITLINETFPHRLIELKKVLDQESKAIFQKLCDESNEAYKRDYAISIYNQAQTAEDYLECRNLFRAINDPFWTAACDMGIADVLPVFDDRGYQYGQEGLALRKAIGDRDGEGSALFIMSAYELCRGNEASAVEMVKEAAACSESVGKRLWAANIRSNLAFFVLEHYGDYEEVIRLSDLAYAVGLEFNNRALILTHLNRMAYIAWAKQDYKQAAQICHEVLGEVLESSQDLPINIKLNALFLLCRVALSQSNLQQARKYLVDYLKLWPFAEYWFIHQALQMLGVLAVKECQMLRAVNVFAAYVALRETLEEQYGLYINPLSPPVRSEYERALAAAHAALGEEAYNLAWEVGRAMTPDQAITSISTLVDPSFRLPGTA